MRKSKHQDANSIFDKIIIGFVGLVLYHLLSCQVQRPEATGTAQNPAFIHANFLQTQCSECHESDRPEAFLDQPHGGGKNCEQCHKSSDEKKGWLPRRSYSHKPEPASCFDCHIKERPKPPHPATGDCVSCHKYPKWLPLRAS